MSSNGIFEVLIEFSFEPSFIFKIFKLVKFKYPDLIFLKISDFES